jgi:hypothetical protein
MEMCQRQRRLENRVFLDTGFAWRTHRTMARSASWSARGAKVMKAGG